jgi:hypothetical protein
VEEEEEEEEEEDTAAAEGRPYGCVMAPLIVGETVLNMLLVVRV